MSEQTQAVLDEALRLTLAERAEVVVERLASLDGDADPDAGPAWAADVERRPRRARECASAGADGQTAQEHVLSRLGEQ